MRERERDRDRETERQRDRQRQTETETETERALLRLARGFWTGTCGWSVYCVKDSAVVFALSVARPTLFTGLFYSSYVACVMFSQF